MIRTIFKISWLVAAILVVRATAQDTADFMDLSLEELLNTSVTSVSKKEQRLFEAAAAVYVITQEDIRRSGVQNVPEALRLVPGVQVAQIDANKWAIGIRGFNSRFSNKLLVLVDGRSVYTHLFSGVYWDAQDMPLQDIERIEVVRGPGATLWGANAVNGVINIVTRRAQDTQGGLLAGGGGTEFRKGGTLRYGHRVNGTAWRAFVRYGDRDALVDPAGLDTPDGWDVRRGGMRLDSDWGDGGQLMVLGEVFSNRSGGLVIQTTSGPPFVHQAKDRGETRGGHIVGQMKKKISGRSDLAMQVSFDRFERDEVSLNQIVQQIEADFQHRFAWGGHEIIWGAHLRRGIDDLSSNFTVAFDPGERSENLISGFAQYEARMHGGQMRLIVGTKFEHNGFTGFEIQPNARLLWQTTPQITMWGAVSRAVRTPSRSDEDIQIRFLAFPGQGGSTTVLTVLGNRDLRSEVLVAYELGGRLNLSEEVLIEAAAFYNVYDQLQTSEPETPSFQMQPVPHLRIPFRFASEMSGRARGGEVNTTWSVHDRWRLTASYSGLQIKLDISPISRDTTAVEAAEQNPEHQFQVRSSMDLPGKLQLDAWVAYVGGVTDVSSHTRLDVRMGWRPMRHLDLSVIGQDLLKARHFEVGNQNVDVVRAQVQRRFLATATWRW